MKRHPTRDEYNMMVRAVAAGHRIEAISRYMAITGCGLTQAQEFVNGLTADLEAERAGKSQFRAPKKRFFGIFGR